RRCPKRTFPGRLSFRRCASPRPADCSYLPALPPSAEESIASIGLEPGHAHAGRQLELFQNLSGPRIDSPHIAFIAFPRAVPQLALDPGHPGDEAVGLDRTKNRSRVGIDLMDLAVAIVSDPERPFGPREPRVATMTGRRDRVEHLASRRVDLLDAIVSQLKEMPSVERGSRVRGDVDRLEHCPACRIEGAQPVAGGKTDALTVIRHSTHIRDTRKGAILSNDFSSRSPHDSILVARQRSGE